MQRFKQMDREMNRWPHAHYPDTYLLHKGYNKFFETHKV
jgi:hypothetical protein